MAKLFFFDLDTTGVRYWKDGIHQISGIIEIDGEVKERFDFKVQPNPKCEISDEALSVGGVTRDQVMSYPEMGGVYRTLTAMLGKYVDKFAKTDKFHLVGFNNRGFDDPFLRAFFVQNLDAFFGSWFWADSIDVMVLASNRFMNERAKLVDFKLKTVCAYAGIEIDESKLHDAIYDIELTRDLYYKITGGHA